MHATTALPPSLVHRAASIARGPHACPNCDSPTWTEPPVPWLGLRDYVVACDACERPIAVHVDRDAIMRATAERLRKASGSEHPYDPVAELLDRRGTRAFVRRLAAAAVLPLVAGLCAIVLQASLLTAMVISTAAVLPSALFAPALAAAMYGWVLQSQRGITHRVHDFDGQGIAIDAARWDQWQREQQRLERERAQEPDAVMRELERVLDERELRRVRALAERGDVPEGHLEDLLRYRRTWHSVA